MASLSTIVQQPAGILGTMHRLGVGNVVGKLTVTMAQPWTWLDHARFINTRSTFMRNRTRASQREIREMVAEANSQAHIDAVNLLLTGDARQKIEAVARIKSFIGRHSLFPLAYVDKWVSSIPWRVAYENALAGRVENVDPQSEADVIAYADQIIRTTFGSGRPEDLPPVMRASELSKLVTPVFSYYSTQYNQLFNEQMPGMIRGRISPIEFVTFFALTFVVQALISEWAAGRWHDDDEDDDQRNKRLALVVAQTPLAGVPLLRDMTRAAVMTYEGRRVTGSSVPAFGAVMDTGAAIGGIAEDVGDGEVDRSTMRAVVMSSGYWFGWPSNAAWRAGEAATDVATGEDDLSDPLDTASEAFLRDTR